VQHIRASAVAHTCNPSYLGDRDWEGHGSRQPMWKFCELPSKSMAGCGGVCLSSQLYEEAQIGGQQTRQT
jgi:hypothetical protein